MLFSAPESILIKTATCEVWQTALCASHMLSTALERRRGLDGQISLNLHTSGNTETTQPRAWDWY